MKQPISLLTATELRELIASEREQGRAWGPVAEEARKWLSIKSGRMAA